MSHSMIAAVLVDQPHVHIDRLFHFRVPDELANTVAVGARVVVRFQGGTATGIVFGCTTNGQTAKLLPVLQVDASEPVLTAETARLVRVVADRYAGTLAEVLRLAVPSRRNVAVASEGPELLPVAPPSTDAWAAYEGGPEFVKSLASGHAPRAAWTAMPGEDWPVRFAEAAAAAAAGGRGAVLVVPNRHDLAALDTELARVLGPGRHVSISSKMDPASRYRAFQRARQGRVKVVAGTRTAVFAPVNDLGLVAIWDDGSDLHAERRAPYPHARDVLTLRAHAAGTGFLAGGHAQTVPVAHLVQSGWASAIVPDRGVLRTRRPRIVSACNDAELERDFDGAGARIPTAAWRAAKAALRAGHPVLVQVAKPGFLPSIACQACRAIAQCSHCERPLRFTAADARPSCTHCGPVAAPYSCVECGATQVRAVAVGVEMTVAELERAFPGTTAAASTGGERLKVAPAHASIVVATPGAEPPAANGYGAVLLLDAAAALMRPTVDAGEAALRRWMRAAALARPDATVVVTADGGLPVVQALLRWDAAMFAARELADRVDAGLPPAARFAAITGPAGESEEAAAALPIELGADVLGPFPVDGDHAAERVLVRVPVPSGLALARALKQVRMDRAAASAVPVRVEMDPLALG